MPGTLWLSISSGYSDESNSPPATPYASIEETFETLWAGLMKTIYLDSSALKSHTQCWVHGLLYLLGNANSNQYNLTPYESDAINDGIPLEIEAKHRAQYISNISCSFTDSIFDFAPQFLTALHVYWRYSVWDEHHRLNSEMYILAIKAICLTNSPGWQAYEMLCLSPIPKCSPQLMQHLFSSDLIPCLANLTSNSDAIKRIFATAQPWLWLNMSLSELDRNNPSLSALESTLLQYSELENTLEKQEEVAEKLEIKLLELLNEHQGECDENENGPLREYIYRVIEIMFQQRSAPLPKNISDGLKDIAENLRGVDSYNSLDTDTLVTDLDIEFVQMIYKGSSIGQSYSIRPALDG